MRLRVCMDCGKAFFSSGWGESARCPHCGVFLEERRFALRYPRVLGLTMSINGSRLSAVTTDLSTGGAGIVLEGGALEKDTVMDVNIEELKLRRSARTVWARITGRRVAAGIELL